MTLAPRETNPRTKPHQQIEEQNQPLSHTPSAHSDKPELTRQNSKLDSVMTLQRAKSEHHFIRQSTLSKEKRVRLKDYLFKARSSLQKNRQLKKDLKNDLRTKLHEASQIKASIELLKKNKYQISNYELQKIVKKQIETQIKSAIEQLHTENQVLQNNDLKNVTNEDLTYYYQIRKLVVENIKPAIHKITQARTLRETKPLVEELFAFGKDLVESKRTAGWNQQLNNSTNSNQEIVLKINSKDIVYNSREALLSSKDAIYNSKEALLSNKDNILTNSKNIAENEASTPFSKDNVLPKPSNSEANTTKDSKRQKIKSVELVDSIFMGKPSLI